ncbi:hypothetical protein JRQ81_001231 [Phrynocephalus forsythii]|uniref:TNFR-Cys domain-containing protein n=1 Tax=Phrynocephalus forsythii TaxID=171643 RepID=A0A9Q0Y9J2_9SAUR|nr:hypothetical protein JRQ81_001231 [Phrynocephalus forsythii]
MALENFREQCFGCGNCRPSFGQITLSNCTSDRDTICGCGKNQYQMSNTPEFFCKNCSSYQNGTIRQHCTRFNDTICECLPGYFLRTDDNSCSPCSSCNNPVCKRRCEALLPSVKNPSNSEQLMFILSSLVVLFGAGCVFLLARKVAKQTCKKNQKPSSGLPSLDTEPTRELTSKVADCPLLVPPLGTK